MESTRPLNSASIMAMELPGSPANIRAEPLAQPSHQLLNGDCWQAIAKHLSARDVVRLSQVDQYLWQLFPRTRKLLNTLVERYYGSDAESQKSWRSALEKIPWSDHRGRFALWQKTHIHDEGVRKWMNSDSLRKRALFRYLSSYSGKIPHIHPKCELDGSTITCMTPILDGRLATGSWDGDITIWDLARSTEQQCFTRLTGHINMVYRLRTLENGLLVSTSWDRSLKIWNLKKTAGKECIMTLQEENASFDIIVLSDYRLVSVSLDNTLTTWDLTGTLEPQRIGFMQMNVDILCTGVLSNGQVVCGCDDNTLKILDLSRPTRQESIAILEGHTAPVRSLIPLPDGTIVSGSYDKKMKIWNPNLPPDSRCIRTLDHSGTIYNLAMLFDGRLIGVSDYDLVIWDLTRPYPEYAIQLQKTDPWSNSVIHLNGQVISHNVRHLQIWCLNELVDSTKSLPDGSQTQQDFATCAAAEPVSSRTRSQTRKRKASDGPADSSKHPKLAE